MKYTEICNLKVLDLIIISTLIHAEVSRSGCSMTSRQIGYEITNNSAKLINRGELHL